MRGLKPFSRLAGRAVFFVGALLGYIFIIASTPSAAQEVEPQSSSSFLRNMAEGHSNNWYIANYSFPSKHYRVGWVRDHVSFSAEGMKLEIDREPTEFQPFSGAEYQRKGKYGYGRYEVVMKPATGSGLVSSFFVHTGSHYGTPHDETSIQFLGRDTTRLQVSLFAANVAETPALIELGFDAANDFNLYAFEWTPERITWFVNDQIIHSIERGADEMPSHPGLIMTNLWTGASGQEDWHGAPSFEDGAAAMYRCISFQKPGDNTPQCSDNR